MERDAYYNYVARPAPGPFPLLFCYTSWVRLVASRTRAGRVRGGPSCVRVCVWAGGRARARARERERWSCGRQVGRRARPPCGAVVGVDGHKRTPAPVRQDGTGSRLRLASAAGVQCMALFCCSTPYGSGAPGQEPF
jgi:hypothetical protein